MLIIESLVDFRGVDDERADLPAPVEDVDVAGELRRSDDHHFFRFGVLEQKLLGLEESLKSAHFYLSFGLQLLDPGC